LAAAVHGAAAVAALAEEAHRDHGNIKRWFRHALCRLGVWRVLFPKAVLADIEKAIKHSEYQHNGELRFAVENTLALGKVWSGMSARQRAIEVFSNLRVWDTEENSGVLIYLLLADRGGSYRCRQRHRQARGTSRVGCDNRSLCSKNSKLG